MPSNLPTISIITPTLNQGRFIKKTIDSVLSQNYPKLEYLIVDGGSTDQTLSIIKKYKNRLKFVSEKDKGQSDALNKGLRLTCGDIIGYLNSDDYLEPYCLQSIGEYFRVNKEANWLTGKCYIVDGRDNEVRKVITAYKNFFLKFLRNQTLFYIVQFISQPATFWRRELHTEVGVFDLNLYYNMDYDFWLRVWQKHKLHFIDRYLASYRIHESAKAMQSPRKQFDVATKIIQRYNKSSILLWLNKFHAVLAVEIYNLTNFRHK